MPWKRTQIRYRLVSLINELSGRPAGVNYLGMETDTGVKTGKVVKL